MDLFQLQRAIGNLEYDSVFEDENYRPFLGVVNYDLSDDLIEKRLKDLCKKATCCDKLYFLVLNTSFSTEDGEHWFLLAFEKTNRLVFYSFNSYGIVNTLNTFGVPRREVLDSRKRLDVLQSLVESVWGGDSAVDSKNLNVIGLNGLHQDFSTDECGYHVYRFASHLYENNTLQKQNATETNWNGVLETYLRKSRIALIPYDDKNLVKSTAQPILLENDKLVRRFCERDTALSDVSNRIGEHDEYQLTEEQWGDAALDFRNSFRLLATRNRRHHDDNDEKSGTKTITIATPLTTVMKRRTRNGKESLKKPTFDSPYKRNVNPITGQHYVVSFDDTFEELYKQTQTSVSRDILKNLFPTHVSTKLNPLLNNIQFSGMIDDPDYLNTFIIQMPGDVSTMTTVGDYFKSLGVVLNAADPFTYQLATLLRSYFENHPDKKTAEQMFARIQKNSMRMWKYVK